MNDNVNVSFSDFSRSLLFTDQKENLNSHNNPPLQCHYQQESQPSMIRFLLDQDSSDSRSSTNQKQIEDSMHMNYPDVSSYLQKQQKLTKLLLSQARNTPTSIPSSKRSGEFKWKQEIHEAFVIVCLAFGIKTVTPKQIQQALQLDAARESIGSHLQKFRMKVAKQHGILVPQLLNTHFPTDDEGGEKAIELKRMWGCNGFSGLSVTETIAFLAK